MLSLAPALGELGEPRPSSSPRPAGMRSAAAPSRLRWPGLRVGVEVRAGLGLETFAEACHGYFKPQIHYLKWKYLETWNLSFQTHLSRLALHPSLAAVSCHKFSFWSFPKG